MPDGDAATTLRDWIAANPVTGTPEEMRRAFARLAGPQPDLPMTRIGGVPVSLAGTDGPIGAIWLHGGGYVFGGPESHGQAASYLAERLGRRVALPHYRRAPEAIWPAPLEDGLAVLDALPDPVSLVGDSAGGHLALHLAFERPRAVRHLALISPNTDRTGRNRSRAENSDTDAMNDDAQDAELAALAFPGTAPDSRAASPLLGPLETLPPLSLTCAAHEVLAQDTFLLACAATHAGVEVDLRVETDLFHMWTLWPQTLPAAARTLDRIATRILSAQRLEPKVRFAG